MGGSWSAVLPLAVSAALLVATVRPGYLRRARPGLAFGQRIGLVLATTPLFLLLFIGIASLPNLTSGKTLSPLSPDLLAAKAALHLALYLVVPFLGLVMVLGPRATFSTSVRQFFGGQASTTNAARGLARAATLALPLTGLLLLGWVFLPEEGGALFSAEGARVFFSNTTPGVALLLAGAAAIAEESLFRGILLGHLKRSTNLHLAVGLQAILFGLIHAGYGSVLHVFAATGFGVLMGYMVHRHGLLPAMVVHFHVNIVILATWSVHGEFLVPVIALVSVVLATAWVLVGPAMARDPEGDGDAQGGAPAVRVVDAVA